MACLTETGKATHTEAAETADWGSWWSSAGNKKKNSLKQSVFHQQSGQCFFSTGSNSDQNLNQDENIFRKAFQFKNGKLQGAWFPCMEERNIPCTVSGRSGHFRGRRRHLWLDDFKRVFSPCMDLVNQLHSEVHWLQAELQNTRNSQSHYCEQQQLCSLGIQLA